MRQAHAIVQSVPRPAPTPSASFARTGRWAGMPSTSSRATFSRAFLSQPAGKAVLVFPPGKSAAPLSFKGVLRLRGSRAAGSGELPSSLQSTPPAASARSEPINCFEGFRPNSLLNPQSRRQVSALLCFALPPSRFFPPFLPRLLKIHLILL